MPKTSVRVTIDDVVDRYRALSETRSGDDEAQRVDQVLRFFRLSVNSHAHNKFNKAEKAKFWRYYVPGRGYRRALSSLFGPEKLPGEVKYFFRHFLGKHAYVSEEFERCAPRILKEFFTWLIDERHLEAFDIDGVFPKNWPRKREVDDWGFEQSIEAAWHSLPPDSTVH